MLGSLVNGKKLTFRLWISFDWQAIQNVVAVKAACFKARGVTGIVNIEAANPIPVDWQKPFNTPQNPVFVFAHIPG